MVKYALLSTVPGRRVNPRVGNHVPPRLLTTLAGYAATPVAPLVLALSPAVARRYRQRQLAATAFDWVARPVSTVRDGYYIYSPSFCSRVQAGQYALPPFDEHGIPVVDYRYMGNTQIAPGRYHNPVTISQWALWGEYERLLAHATEAQLAGLLVQARWLTAAQTQDGRWPYQFALPAYDKEPGWISAMAQGEGASVLMRAYAESGDEQFLDAARRALSPFWITVDKGGVLSRDSMGTWLEEVPEDEPSHILNGEVFALFGLWDHYLMTGDGASKALFDEVADTLARNLGRFAEGHIAFYDLKRQKSINESPYLPIHIAQLEALTHITGAPIFADTATQWCTLRTTPEPLPPGRLVLRAWSEVRREHRSAP